MMYVSYVLAVVSSSSRKRETGVAGKTRECVE